MIKSSKMFQIFIFVIAALIFGIFLYHFNVSHPVTYNKQNGKSYVKYEKAQVLSVKNIYFRDKNTHNWKIIPYFAD